MTAEEFLTKHGTGMFPAGSEEFRRDLDALLMTARTAARETVARHFEQEADEKDRLFGMKGRAYELRLFARQVREVEV